MNFIDDLVLPKSDRSNRKLPVAQHVTHPQKDGEKYPSCGGYMCRMLTILDHPAR
jgi:hypothetical protein